MIQKILVIGERSFIARHWLADSRHSIIAIPHDGLETLQPRQFNVIVNCAVSPALKAGAYREADDFDLIAARRAADTGCHFVMLSTRKVYKPSASRLVLDETSTIEPDGWYGENKLESERRVTATLGARGTILRIANVYGYEYGRRSFFGIASSKLKNEGRIALDTSPFVERDFVPMKMLAGLLDHICEQQPSGIYNLGSGYGLPLGRIAQWLILGYGRGVLDISDLAERDAFIMNPGKLLASLALPPLHHDFETDIRSIGRQLQNE